MPARTRRSHRSRWSRPSRTLTIALSLAALAGVLPLGPPASAQVHVPAAFPLVPVLLPPLPIPDDQRQLLPVPDLDPEVLHKKITFPWGDSATSPLDKVAGLVERTSEDSAYVSVYDVGGGSHLADVTATPQNYETPDGWAKVDPTLVLGDGYYQDIGGGDGINMPASLNKDQPTTFTLAGGSLAVYPLDASTSTAVQTGPYHLLYPATWPTTDLAYTSLADGPQQEIIFEAQPEGGQVSFDVVATGLGLRAEPSGDISVLSADQVVATMPKPVAYDSQIDPVTGSGVRSEDFTWQLTDLTGGHYRLTLGYAQQWLADQNREYPVTVRSALDWAQTAPSPDIRPGSDTYVNDCSTGSAYGGESELFAGSTNTCSYRSFVHLPVPTRTDRVVYQAQLQLYGTYANGTDNVKVKRATESWEASSTTWSHQPAVASREFAATPTPPTTAPSYPWQLWDLDALYAHVGSRDWPDNGIRLEATTLHRYASNNYSSPGAVGHLFLVYNDIPAKVNPANPPSGKTVTVESPSLWADGLPTDPNGDDTWIQFQVSTKTGADFESGIVTRSPWQDSPNWPIDGGVLKDGQTYYWRIASGDVCLAANGDRGLCSNTDGDGTVHPWKTSAISSFSVALPHLGTDDRWAMWSGTLGNGMQLKVNQANGNANLSYPLDALATPIGPLAISLAYNSQSQTADDIGLGTGWNVAAGPASDGTKLPTKLRKIDQGSGDAVRIRFADGDVASIPHQSGYTYRGFGAGSGIVTENPNPAAATDPAWTYVTPNGGRYTFDADGDPLLAKPSTDVRAGQEGFSYLFDSTSHLVSVQDPLGRIVLFTWNAGQLIRIKTWDGRTWFLGYDLQKGELASVTDPAGNKVTFRYGSIQWGSGTLPLLTEVRDGQLVADGSTASTRIGYLVGSPTTVPPRPNRVRAIWAPVAATPTLFHYGDPTAGIQNGDIVKQTAVTDPRGTTGLDPGDANAGSTATPGAYKIWTDFDTAGLPVRIHGPADQSGAAITTRMVWDTDGNLRCARSPAANQAGGETQCIYSAGMSYDALSSELDTDYTYQRRRPHLLESVTAPAPAAGGTRATTTYHFDEGLTGLVWDRWNNVRLSGMPDASSITNGLDVSWDWGSGAPAGISPPDKWSMRLSGYLTATRSDMFRFRLYGDDGTRMSIGNKLLVDCWHDSSTYQANCGQGVAKKWLSADTPSPIAIEYYDAAGSAALELQWFSESSGAWVKVPPGRFTPDLNLVTSIDDPAGTTTRTYGTDLHRLRGLPTRVLRGTRYDDYLYDDYGRVLRDTNALGGEVTNVYTEACLTSRTDRTGGLTEYTCNGAGDITQVKSTIRPKDGQPAQTRVVDNSYDGLGRLTLEAVPHQPGMAGNPYTENQYDAAGRIWKVKDPTGKVTTFAYDLAGHQSQVTYPDPDGAGALLAPTVKFGFDAMGNRTTVADPMNKTWITAYDALNRVIAQTDPIPGTPNTTTTDYDLSARTTTVTDSAAVKSTTTFDLLGRKVSEQLGNLSGKTLYEYDDSGNMTKVTDPAGIPVSSVYNAFGEVTKQTRPTGSGGANIDTLFSYDDGGRETSVTDGRTKVTNYGYDAEGRLTSATPPGLPATWFSFDDAGERVKVTDGAGRIRSFKYDVRGRLDAATDGRGTTTFTYDDDGRLLTEALPTGLTRVSQYDALGRRTDRHGVRSGSTVDAETFSYFDNGLLKSAQNATATVGLTYDEAGRPLTVTEGAFTTTYGYTRAQLTSVTDASGTTAFTYRPADGLLATVTDPFSATPTTFAYDAASGRPKSKTDPAGVTTTRTYDPAGRIATQIAKKGATLASFALGYDEVSNVLSKQATVSGAPAAENGTWSYGYDDANRMTSATAPGGTTTNYGYDGAGNRTTVKVGAGPTVTTHFDAAGYPDSATDGSTYTVDAAGELTAISGSRTWTYGYDSWGRLASATGSGGSPVVSYAYDALDRTLNRTKGAQVTSYAYQGTGEDLVQQTVSGATTMYGNAPGGPLAQKQGLNTRYFVSDLHDDVVGLVDKTTGNVVGTTAFGAWGEHRATSGEQATLGFQGDPTDPDTGLVDMTTRLYDPMLGRFQTKDVLFGEPTSPMSLNQLAYGEGHPMNGTDPTGMKIEWCVSGGGDCMGNGGGGSANDPYKPDDNPYTGPEGGSDIFLHGHGDFSVPQPVFKAGDFTVLATNVVVLAALRELSDALQRIYGPGGGTQLRDLVITGLAVGARSAEVIVTGFSPRTGRFDYVTGSEDACRGLFDCLIVGEKFAAARRVKDQEVQSGYLDFHVGLGPIAIGYVKDRKGRHFYWGYGLGLGFSVTAAPLQQVNCESWNANGGVAPWSATLGNGGEKNKWFFQLGIGAGGGVYHTSVFHCNEES